MISIKKIFTVIFIATFVSAISFGITAYAAAEPCFTVQPQDAVAAGGDTVTITWDTNFAPYSLAVYRNEEKIFDLDKNAKSAELPASSYFYFIRATYEPSASMPEMPYIDSEQFAIEQTAAFTRQPESSTAAGSDLAEISWETNFTPSKIEIYRHDAVLMEFSPENTVKSVMLPASDYNYFIRLQYETFSDEPGENYIDSETFAVNQTADFIQQPENVEAAGSNTGKISWKTNFAPSKIEIYRNGSKIEDVDKNASCVYLPASASKYVLRIYYEAFSDEITPNYIESFFSVDQIGAVTVQPQNSTAAGDNMALISWDTNFVPSSIDVYRNEQKLEWDIANTAKSVYLPASNSAYFLRFNYETFSDELIPPYVESERFKIEQTAAFTVQPQDTEVFGDEGAQITWKTNFTPYKTEILYNGKWFCDVENNSDRVYLPTGDGLYTVCAYYYAFENDDDRVYSDRFFVRSGIRGDINNDGVCDKNDAKLLLAYLSGTAEIDTDSLKRAKMLDDDKPVSILDVIEMLK